MSDGLPVSLEKALTLEQEIQKMPQVYCPVKHYFAGDMYARELTIPGGVVLTGAIHKTDHICTLSQGRISVTTDTGLREIVAPETFVAKAGSKRVGYAMETSVWTTYHYVGKERDLNKIMLDITDSAHDMTVGGLHNTQRVNNMIDEDRRDYAKFLDEFGLSQSTVDLLMDRADQDPTEEVWVLPNVIHLGESRIHGRGFFASTDIDNACNICFARKGNKRTPAGRFINHSCRPNVVFVAHERGDIMVRTMKAINKGDEIVVDYRLSTSISGLGIAPVERVES